MKVYLDNCCYNRPYDDQSKMKIALEAQAKLKIQRKIKSGKLQLVSSFMTRLENSENPFAVRRDAINDFINLYVCEYVGTNHVDAILHTAERIINTGVKSKDALHVACAIEAGCDYFITTDDRLLKYRSDIIKVVNPIVFLEMEANNYE